MSTHNFESGEHAGSFVRVFRNSRNLPNFNMPGKWAKESRNCYLQTSGRRTNHNKDGQQNRHYSNNFCLLKSVASKSTCITLKFPKCIQINRISKEVRLLELNKSHSSLLCDMLWHWSFINLLFNTAMSQLHGRFAKINQEAEHLKKKNDF